LFKALIQIEANSPPNSAILSSTTRIECFS